jgi:hypothetical protein
MKTRLLAAVSVAAAAACGGGSASNSVSGNIQGSPFPVSDTISGNVTFSTLTTTTNMGAIIMTSSPGNLCSNQTESRQIKNSRRLAISVADRSGSGTIAAPAAAGTYAVVDAKVNTTLPKFAWVTYVETDATCHSIALKQLGGASGTVTLTTVNSGSYAGSFEITFDNGDKITGSFSASNCPGLQSDSRPPTCI